MRPFITSLTYSTLLCNSSTSQGFPGCRNILAVSPSLETQNGMFPKLGIRKGSGKTVLLSNS